VAGSRVRLSPAQSQVAPRSVWVGIGRKRVRSGLGRRQQSSVIFNVIVFGRKLNLRDFV
jgi:hypothetical protein